MGVGSHRLFRWRTWGRGDDEHEPEPGDFMVATSTRPPDQWAVYRILRVVLVRDVIEPWCNGGHPDREDGIPEGMICRVLHYRIGTVRVAPDERPDDAMTWYAGPPDKPHHPHP